LILTFCYTIGFANPVYLLQIVGSTKFDRSLVVDGHPFTDCHYQTSW